MPCVWNCHAFATPRAGRRLCCRQRRRVEWCTRGKKWRKVGPSSTTPTSFLGEFEHTIDDKGRLAVPARFRTALEDGLVITRGIERCLVMYDAASWSTISERLHNLNPWQHDARRMQRHFFSGAVPARPDKLGRVVIPHYLRDYAELQTEVVVVGVSDRIEVWSRAAWLRERSEAERDSAELAEHLAGSRTEA